MCVCVCVRARARARALSRAVVSVLSVSCLATLLFSD